MFNFLILMCRFFIVKAVNIVCWSLIASPFEPSLNMITPFLWKGSDARGFLSQYLWLSSTPPARSTLWHFSWDFSNHKQCQTIHKNVHTPNEVDIFNTFHIVCVFWICWMLGITCITDNMTEVTYSRPHNHTPGRRLVVNHQSPSWCVTVRHSTKT